MKVCAIFGHVWGWAWGGQIRCMRCGAEKAK